MVDWIRDKKATINSKNEDNKCFKYAATVALNYKETESHLERVSTIKPFINKYNWKGINYPSKLSDWKTFEKNSSIIALNILHSKEKQIFPAYISNSNLIGEKQIILLTIPNKQNSAWHYLAVEKISAVF